MKIYFYVISEREGRDLLPLREENYYVVNDLGEADTISKKLPRGEYECHSVSMELVEESDVEINLIYSFSVD